MKLLSKLICIFFVATTAFADWVNYTSPFPIRAAVPLGEGLIMATGGGVRYRTLSVDNVYTTSNGLGDQSISAVVISDAFGVFSVSDYGIISLLGENGAWHIKSRSYAGNKVRLIPGMARVGGVNGEIMVLAFEDRLSFFSLRNMTSILTVERIRDVNLSITPISAMETRGDSLYVATGSSLYVRKMDWGKLESDSQLNNPNSWKLVKNASSDSVDIKCIAWKDDKLQTFSTEGTRIWDKDGETLVAIDTFSVFNKSDKLVVVRGKTLKDSVLYERDSIMKIEKKETTVERYYYRSKVQWVTLLPSKKAILAGPDNIFFYDGKKVYDYTFYMHFPLKGAYELQALPKGGVLAASMDGWFSYNSDDNWSEPRRALSSGLGNRTDALGHNMKVLSVQPSGSTFYHIWGIGYFLYSEWGNNLEHGFLANADHCMDSFLENMRYSIAISTTPAPNGSGFLTTSASYKGHYSLIYVSEDGSISCANNIGSSSIGGPMLARVNEKGDWVVYVGTRAQPATDADGGLDVFTFQPPNRRGGELVVHPDSVKTYYGPSTTPLDFVYEPKSGYFWIVTTSSLEYWNAEQDSLMSPLSTNGLTGSGFTSIDVDSRGNLWVGTSTQGAFRLTPRSTSPDTLSVLHFTTRQGLLSDKVQDIAVDSIQGYVWFAHQTGITRYRRNDLRSTDGNMTSDARQDVKVYPNPFRPRIQPYVVFENITDDAVIEIYNRGGKLVASLRGDEVVGGRAEWDGKMRNGDFVAPGVYQYVIRGASKAKKGKLLIIH